MEWKVNIWLHFPKFEVASCADMERSWFVSLITSASIGLAFATGCPSFELTLPLIGMFSSLIRCLHCRTVCRTAWSWVWCPSKSMPIVRQCIHRWIYRARGHNYGLHSGSTLHRAVRFLWGIAKEAKMPRDRPYVGFKFSWPFATARRPTFPKMSG